jgi:hypothetical protein
MHEVTFKFEMEEKKIILFSIFKKKNIFFSIANANNFRKQIIIAII